MNMRVILKLNISDILMAIFFHFLAIKTVKSETVKSNQRRLDENHIDRLWNIIQVKSSKDSYLME